MRVKDGPHLERGSRVEVALKLLDKGDKLLDIGCGDGTLGYFANHKYRMVYEVDISENACEIAEKRGVITRKVNLNEEKLPFKNEYFDAITCSDVIEHVFEPYCLLAEIQRVCKRGGLVVISTPNIRHWYHLYTLIIKSRFPKTSGDIEHWDGGHLHYFTYKYMEELFREYGFETTLKKGVFGRDILKGFLSTGIMIKAVKI